MELGPFHLDFLRLTHSTVYTTRDQQVSPISSLSLSLSLSEFVKMFCSKTRGQIWSFLFLLLNMLFCFFLFFTLNLRFRFSDLEFEDFFFFF